MTNKNFDLNALKNISGLLKPRMTHYIPHTPTAKQLAFLIAPNREVLFGGAAGGGKSDALLMAALQYVDIPGYAALLLRKTLTDLKQSEALLDRMMKWMQPYLTDKEVIYRAETHTFRFKCFDKYGERLQDASIAFGYIGESNAYTRYQGIELQMVGFDEVTQHSENDYTYLFSRLRKCRCRVHKENFDKNCEECRRQAMVPLRMRCTANPGGVGHKWVQERFKIEPDMTHEEAKKKNTHVRWTGKHKERLFIPSFAVDNPFLDQKEYNKSLEELSEEHKARLKFGDWGFIANARFKRLWQRYYSQAGAHIYLGPNFSGRILDQRNDIIEVFQTMDVAASSKEGPGDIDLYPNNERSWTVISTFALTKCYNLLWLDMVRFREEIPEVVDIMLERYNTWKPSKVIVEQNGIGKGVVQYATRLGMVVEGVHKEVDKVVNSTTAVIQMKNGRIWYPMYAGWLKEHDDEVFLWQGHPTETDDIVDTLSLAANYVRWENAVKAVEEYYEVTESPYGEVPVVFSQPIPINGMLRS